MIFFQADVSFAGYKAHVLSQSAPAPLTFAEEELKLIKETETNHHINVDTKHQTVQGLNFPIAQDALDRLRELGEGAINYIQLVSVAYCCCSFSHYIAAICKGVPNHSLCAWDSSCDTEISMLCIFHARSFQQLPFSMDP